MTDIDKAREIARARTPGRWEVYTAPDADTPAGRKEKLLAGEQLEPEWHCVCCVRQSLRLRELERQIDAFRIELDEDGDRVYRSSDIANQAFRLKQTLKNIRRIDAEAETWAKEQVAAMRLEVKP